MPVEKFRSIEDASAAAAARDAARGAEGAIGRFRAACALVSVFSPHRYPRGVRKFRSIEDANADREAAEQASTR